MVPKSSETNVEKNEPHRNFCCCCCCCENYMQSKWVENEPKTSKGWKTNRETMCVQRANDNVETKQNEREYIIWIHRFVCLNWIVQKYFFFFTIRIDDNIFFILRLCECECVVKCVLIHRFIRLLCHVAQTKLLSLSLYAGSYCSSNGWIESKTICRRSSHFIVNWDTATEPALNDDSSMHFFMSFVWSDDRKFQNHIEQFSSVPSLFLSSRLVPSRIILLCVNISVTNMKSNQSWHNRYI